MHVSYIIIFHDILHDCGCAYYFSAQGSADEYTQKLQESCTLYVGNLSFYTNEDQIYELFGMCGEVKRIIMGLDRVEQTPCGFCFVEYHMVKLM